MRQLMRRYFTTPLLTKMGIGFAIGVAIGLIFGPSAAFIQPLGELFLRLLQMVVVPLIFFTLVVGASAVAPAQLGRLGGKALGYYLLTSTFAVGLGLGLAWLVQPGRGLTIAEEATEAPEPLSLVDFVLGLVPTNPFAALSAGQILPMITFAVIIGIALATLRHSEDPAKSESGQMIYRLFQGGSELMFLVVRGVLEYAPIGVAALIANTLGTTGIAGLIPLARLTGVLFAGILLQFVVYALLLRLLNVNLKHFITALIEPLTTALVTRSSNATLPVSMRAAEKMGVSESVYSLTLPLGATINMDGLAIYMGATVVFAANIAGVELTFSQILGVVLTGVLGSIGAAGIPSGGLLVLSLALTQAGLPLGAIALVAGIDAILDMARTACNITGDLVGTKAIASTEKNLPTGEIVPEVAGPI